jgi:hypothetical protein
MVDQSSVEASLTIKLTLPFCAPEFILDVLEPELHPNKNTGTAAIMKPKVLTARYTTG